MGAFRATAMSTSTTTSKRKMSIYFFFFSSFAWHNENISLISHRLFSRSCVLVLRFSLPNHKKTAHLAIQLHFHVPYVCYSKYVYIIHIRIGYIFFHLFAVAAASWFSVWRWGIPKKQKKNQVGPRTRKKKKQIVGRNIEAEAKLNVDRNWNTFTEKLRIIFACTFLQLEWKKKREAKK